MSFYPVFILTSLLGFMEGWVFGILLGLPQEHSPLGPIFLGLANYAIFQFIFGLGAWLGKTGKVRF